MSSRSVPILGLCLGLAAAAAWLGQSRSGDRQVSAGWQEVAAGILRSEGIPAGYALVEGSAALLIDAPQNDRGLKARGITTIEGVLLTHYHRSSCAQVGDFLARKIQVRAPRKAQEWLTPEGVAKYWKESLPLRGSRTAYLVVPEGHAGIDHSLEEGQKVSWCGWELEVVATPGHALAHMALAGRKGKSGPLVVFSGGAFAAPGKIWAPYTTDWDHWTDSGLVPTARSLRKLAELKPALLLPAHGPALARNTAQALLQTAVAAEEVGFLKSFERFTKKRLGNAPTYPFLAPEQAQTGGDKPWSRISEHLFLTGNTYVLTSKDGSCLMIDPWDKRSAVQFAKLQNERKLGPLEVVMFSHAHYDHYDGIYYLPDREKFEVWTLDRVAPPLAEPFRWRAPFLDHRPVKFDRRPREGQTLAWREYRFRFHFLPGQTEFTMGVQAQIDGKQCFFTADNFFHQDMFSGSGGWMGLNRSWPLPYAESAQKVLEARPDWVLAEHGGPFQFNAEDFRRRVQWGQVSARAADALCLSGNHRFDWDPHRLQVEPLLQKARAGMELNWELAAHNPLPRKQNLHISLAGRKWLPDRSFQLQVPAAGRARLAFATRLPGNLPPGRHIFILECREGAQRDAADTFFAIDVEP